MPTIRDALRWGDSTLKDAHIESAERDARLLLARATARELSWILAHPEFEVDQGSWNRFTGWIEQRAAGKPIPYLVGYQEFYGRDFMVSPAVLIPRPETELLIEQGLRILRSNRSGKRGPQPERPSSQWSVVSGQQLPADDDQLGGLDLLLADIGTGSGCIAVTLAIEIPRAKVVATDISEAALQVARENAGRHGVAGRIQFYQADLLPGVGEQFDAIFSNPPYVASGDARLAEEVRTYEPAVALFGGESGMEMYRRIVPLGAERLKPGGWLLLELACQSEQEVRGLFESSRWESLEVFPDLQGIARCLVARAVGTPPLTFLPAFSTVA